MATDKTARRSHEHSAFRIVLLVYERTSFPVTRDEVTSEAVFKRLRVVKIIEDVYFVGAAGTNGLFSAFEIPAIVASVDNAFFFADFTGLIARVATFTDDQLIHDFRNIVFQGLKLVLEGHQFRIVHAHARSPSFTLIS